MLYPLSYGRMKAATVSVTCLFVCSSSPTLEERPAPIIVRPKSDFRGGARPQSRNVQRRDRVRDGLPADATLPMVTSRKALGYSRHAVNEASKRSQRVGSRHAFVARLMAHGRQPSRKTAYPAGLRRHRGDEGRGSLLRRPETSGGGTHRVDRRDESVRRRDRDRLSAGHRRSARVSVRQGRVASRSRD